MSEHALAAYLNDHLAGSTAALELLQEVEKAHAGSAAGRFVARLRQEISADRKELEALMARLQVTASAPRRAATWLAEKLAGLKLRLDDQSGGTFRLLETLDALSIGIEGKRLLWRALATAAEGAPELQGPNYAYLVQCADQQRRQLETLRLEAARTALSATPAEEARS